MDLNNRTGKHATKPCALGLFGHSVGRRIKKCAKINSRRTNDTLWHNGEFRGWWWWCTPLPFFLPTMVILAGFFFGGGRGGGAALQTLSNILDLPFYILNTTTKSMIYIYFRISRVFKDLKYFINDLLGTGVKISSVRNQGRVKLSKLWVAVRGIRYPGTKKESVRDLVERTLCLTKFTSEVSPPGL